MTRAREQSPAEAAASGGQSHAEASAEGGQSRAEAAGEGGQSRAEAAGEGGYVAAVILVLGAFLVVYWPVITGLVHDWSTDDNYSHGFFIVPLALYFAWERRAAIAGPPVRPPAVGLAIVGSRL